MTPTLLGGLTADEFLREYWQKKPLLVRGALPGFTGLLSRDEMLDLACRHDVESRFVSQAGDWTIAHGPFSRAGMIYSVGFRAAPAQDLAEIGAAMIDQVAGMLAGIRLLAGRRMLSASTLSPNGQKLVYDRHRRGFIQLSFAPRTTARRGILNEHGAAKRRTPATPSRRKGRGGRAVQ